VRNDILPSDHDMTRRVAFVIFPGFQILDATGPIAAFEIAGRYQPGAYELRVLAPEAGPVASSSGVAIAAAALDEARNDTIVVAGGDGARALAQLKALVAWLKARSALTPRI